MKVFKIYAAALLVLVVVSSIVISKSDVVDAVTSSGNNIFTRFPADYQVESDLDYYFSGKWGTDNNRYNYYSDISNYKLYVINSYADGDASNVNYTRMYMFPDIGHFFLDMTHIEVSTLANKYRFMPVHSHNCLVINAMESCISGCPFSGYNVIKSDWLYETYCLPYYEFNYDSLSWEFNVRESSASNGLYWDGSKCQVYLYSNDIDVYVENASGGFVYNTQGLNDPNRWFTYGDEVQLHYSYDPNDVDESIYPDVDIKIEINDGIDYTWEEVTEDDDLISTIKKYVKNIWNSSKLIVDKLTNIPKTIVQGIYDYVGKPIRSILNYMIKLPVNMLEAAVEHFEKWFIPRDGFFEDYFDALKSKFGFIDSVINIKNEMQRVIMSTLNSHDEPPKVELDISQFITEDNPYKDSLPDEVTVIDFKWYKPYKPFVDIFVTAFIYVNFYMRLIVNLPNIIMGTAGGVGSMTAIDKQLDINAEIKDKSSRPIGFGGWK